MPKGKSSMTSVRGLYSSKSNPVKDASRVASKMGPGGNADQAKANRLLQQAHAKNESLRGKMGM